MKDPRISFAQSVTTDTTALTLLNTTTITIVVGRADLFLYNTQVLIFVLATTLVRLFNRVEIVADEDVPVHRDMPFLAGRFVQAMRQQLWTVRRIEDSAIGGGSVTVAIGSSVTCAADIYLGASGWTMRFSSSSPTAVSENRNPVGALAAGAIGAAETFKRVFRGLLSGSVTQPGYSLSLLTYSESTDEDEPVLPDVVPIDAVLFGCGSIGCGFLQAALFTPAANGTLKIVDNGRFEEDNCYKYPLLGLKTASERPYKAVWAQALTSRERGDRLRTSAHVATVDQFVASQPVNYLMPVAVSAVDNLEARIGVQDALPKVVLNAGISGTLAETSVHTFGDGACLACLCLRQQLESWNASRISEQTGLASARVRELILGNIGLTAADIGIMKDRYSAQTDIVGELDRYLDQPLLSFWNRVGYGQTTATSGETVALITTAFVPAFAGILLLAELLKQSVPELRRYALNNSYQQQLLGVPADQRLRYERDQTGDCICHSSFREGLYAQKYGN